LRADAIPQYPLGFGELEIERGFFRHAQAATL